MKKIKKKITSFITVTALASFVLTGCGGSESSSSTSSSEDGKTTLTWAVWDVDATTYYEPLIEAYEAANKDVKVELLDLGSTDYMTVLGTQLSGGDSSIDVASIKDVPGYSTLVNMDQLEGLSDYINESGLDLNAYNGIAEQLKIDDELYALPFRNDFGVMYYNKDLFDAAGVDYPTNGMTVEEYDAMIREVSEKASKKLGEHIYGGHYHTWRSQVQLYGILDGKHTLVADDYSFLKNYYDLALAQQEDEIVQDYSVLKTSSLHYSAAFYQNNVATLVIGTWFIPTLAEAIETGESSATNWGIASMPVPDSAEKGASSATITGIAVSSASKQKEEAYKFAEFVAGEEGAKIIAESGTMPAIQSEDIVKTISSIDGFPSDEGSLEALRVGKTYLEMPVADKVSEIDTILNDAHDNIMTKNADVADELEKASKQISELLK